MNETWRWERQGPPAQRLRIVGARPEGFRVELQLLDGTTSRAWVPRSVVDDARLRINANRDLIAHIGDHGPLGDAGLQVVALLCAQPDLDDPRFTEVHWSEDSEGGVGDFTELPTERYVSESSLVDRRPDLVASPGSTGSGAAGRAWLWGAIVGGVVAWLTSAFWIALYLGGGYVTP